MEHMPARRDHVRSSGEERAGQGHSAAVAGAGVDDGQFQVLHADGAIEDAAALDSWGVAARFGWLRVSGPRGETDRQRSVFLVAVAEHGVVIVCGWGPSVWDEEPGAKDFLAGQYPELDPDPADQDIGRVSVGFDEKDVLVYRVEVEKWGKA